MRRTVLTLFLMLAVCGLSLMAQTPSTDTPQQIHADLNQLMRGVLYPAANVVFSAQADDPGEVKLIPGHDPSMSTDPLTSTFGGWQAVANAALALAESANLLLIPGRSCSNGAPVPTKDPAWATFVQQLRDASMKSYKAAQAKNQDAILDVSDKVTTACASCHDVYREKTEKQGGLAARCTK